MAHWGIVGGGLLGMTLARRLREAGHRVTLLEAGPSLGGLATAWSIGDVVWDRHYHVILLSDSYLRDLLADLGLQSKARWTQTRSGFYTNGRLHSMSDAVEFLTFPLLNLVEKFRLGATILHASRIHDWKPLEHELVGDWLTRWSGRPTFEKLWLPLLRAKLGDSYTRTSAAFIWATIARMYAARRTGLKKEMFGYVEGGYATILERYTEFLREAGVQIVISAPARRVERLGQDGIQVTFGEGRTETFDRVVVTVPAPVALAVCRGLSEAEIEQHRNIEYVGIVCPSALLRRPLSPYYITNILDSWVPFTAVIETSTMVGRETFGGQTLIYLPKYASPGDPIFERSDQEIEETFVGALQRMHPGLTAQDVMAFKVSRVRQVFALPTLGYSERLPPTATAVSGLHIINSTHIVNGTLNVNETLQLAERMMPSLLT